MQLRKRFIIGILISLVFLYLAVRKVDFEDLWMAIKNANYWWTVPNMILMVFSTWMRAYRWKFMVNPIKRLKVYPLFTSTMIGFMANNVLPARLGEFVRAYSLGEKAEISKSAAFATIVVERVFDGFSLLFILWITLLFSHFPDWVKRAGNITLILNIALLFTLIFLEVKTEPTLRFFKGVFKFLPSTVSTKASEILYKFTTGLKVFRDWSSILWILVWSLLIWAVIGISNCFIFFAFNLYPPFHASFILLIMVALAVMLPSSPGYIGTFQYACIIALGLFGISQSVAFSFSVVLWVSQFLPITSLGLYYLKKEHLSLKGAREERGKVID